MPTTWSPFFSGRMATERMRIRRAVEERVARGAVHGEGVGARADDALRQGGGGDGRGDRGLRGEDAGDAAVAAAVVEDSIAADGEHLAAAPAEDGLARALHLERRERPRGIRRRDDGHDAHAVARRQGAGRPVGERERGIAGVGVVAGQQGPRLGVEGVAREDGVGAARTRRLGGGLRGGDEVQLGRGEPAPDERRQAARVKPPAERERAEDHGQEGVAPHACS